MRYLLNTIIAILMASAVTGCLHLRHTDAEAYEGTEPPKKGEHKQEPALATFLKGLGQGLKDSAKNRPINCNTYGNWTQCN